VFSARESLVTARTLMARWIHRHAYCLVPKTGWAGQYRPGNTTFMHPEMCWLWRSGVSGLGNPSGNGQATDFLSHYLELSVHFSSQIYSSWEAESVAKSKDQKKKDREKRVAKQKLADAARRREIAKKSDDGTSTAARGRKVMTAGVKQHAQVQTSKPSFAHRRTGG
jgi:hypothetical protein